MRYALGPYNSENEAENVGLAKFNVYEVVQLNTVSTSEATRRLKAMDLEQGASIEDATERVRHTY